MFANTGWLDNFCLSNWCLQKGVNMGEYGDHVPGSEIHRTPKPEPGDQGMPDIDSVREDDEDGEGSDDGDED